MDFETVLGRVVEQAVLRALDKRLGASAAAEYEDTEQVAKRTGLSVPTLRAYRGSGEGPPFSKVGRRVMYKISDVDEWMLSKRMGASD